jgi:hypothetical protein
MLKYKIKNVIYSITKEAEFNQKFIKIKIKDYQPNNHSSGTLFIKNNFQRPKL